MTTFTKRILSVAIILAASSARVWADLPINTLASFNNDNGASPQSGLTLSADGTTLYGTAYGGGTNGYGTVFSVPVAGGTPNVLVSFTGGGGGWPIGGLTLSGSTLYGTTTVGGASNDGVVFSIPVTGGPPAFLGVFNQATNGNTPQATLTVSGNKLYGTTQSGGANNYGTVFSIPFTGGEPTVLASFNGTNGAYAYAGLTLSGNGTTLYGTTPSGGANNYGTVFSIPIAGGPITVLTSFDWAHGASSDGGLTLSADGTTLYGTTSAGGDNGNGTVFSLPITGGTTKVLASFNGTNGDSPFCNLTLSADGTTFYGATGDGGANNLGTVFSVPVTGGPVTVLATFDGTNGAYAAGDLTLSADGTTLYGTTAGGGAIAADGNNYGTVFSISLVPEPASLAVLAMVVPALLMRRRR